MEFNLADLFESVADVVPGETAMVCGSRRLTYEELDGRANRLAHYLAGAGIERGDRVGLQLVNGTEYIEGMLACFKIGAVSVNVNFRYVASELRYVFQDASLSGLVFHSRFRPAVSEALDGLAPLRVRLEVADSGSPAEAADDYESALVLSRVSHCDLRDL